MEITPNHRIEFEGVDSKEIMNIPDPIYIYKVGDIIECFGMIDEKTEKREEFGRFEVVIVKHELFDSIVGEQVVVFKLKKIYDTKGR